ncbi:MAG: glycine zipper 2TM domain-containing protein [Betaproteobacteria bacterium]|jgi:uncharacterized protein YcfJ
MTRLVIPILLALGSGLTAAQEVGRVISSTPVIQQIAVPRQVCTTQQVSSPGAKSGAGAVMGAIAGGAIGNNIGDGTGRAVATMIGLVGGAMLGDRVEGAPAPQVQNVQSCTTQTFYENRTMSYNVVYEFNGKQYQVSMPSDPGPTVKLQISPISATSPSQPPVTSAVQGETQVREVVVVERPTYVTTHRSHYIRPYPYYAPIGLNLEFGYPFSGHRHWR